MQERKIKFFAKIAGIMYKSPGGFFSRAIAALHTPALSGCDECDYHVVILDQWQQRYHRILHTNFSFFSSR